MNKISDFLSKHYNIILFFAVVFFLMYLADKMTDTLDRKIFEKEQEIKNLEKQIEELELQNGVYLDSIKVLQYLEDSLIVYKDGVIIEKIKIQTVYENKISDIDSYTITQIDSVLSDRYN
jgi:ABC-type microcin C transport system duplicated ATPase subunit YejF